MRLTASDGGAADDDDDEEEEEEDIIIEGGEMEEDDAMLLLLLLMFACGVEGLEPGNGVDADSEDDVDDEDPSRGVATSMLIEAEEDEASPPLRPPLTPRLVVADPGGGKEIASGC
jgi:hypothetical protein